MGVEAGEHKKVEMKTRNANCHGFAISSYCTHTHNYVQCNMETNLAVMRKRLIPMVY